METSYEVQLVESSRRLGLGNFLVRGLIGIARKWKMEKVMLTCLKGGVYCLHSSSELNLVP